MQSYAIHLFMGSIRLPMRREGLFYNSSSEVGSYKLHALDQNGVNPVWPDALFRKLHRGHGNKTFLVSISGGHSPYYTRSYGGIQLQTDELWTYKNYGLDVIGNL